MRNKRNVQINVCLTLGEMKRLRQRAKRETEGNVSRLVREVLFAGVPFSYPDAMEEVRLTRTGTAPLITPVVIVPMEIQDELAAMSNEEQSDAVSNAEQLDTGQLSDALREALRKAGTLAEDAALGEEVQSE